MQQDSSSDSPYQLLRCLECRARGSFDSNLTRRDEALLCDQCGTAYPIRSGIPVLVRNGATLAEDGWLTPTQVTDGIQATERSNAVETALQLSTYTLAHYPDAIPSGHLREKLETNIKLAQSIKNTLARIQRPAGPSVEVGCGPCGFGDCWTNRGNEWTILGDLNLSALRVGYELINHGRTEVSTLQSLIEATQLSIEAELSNRLFPILMDALNPPLAAESCSLVAAMNLLDSVNEPWILLGQMDALLRNDGLMVLTIPYQYDPSVTAPAGWIDGPESLRRILKGQFTPLNQLRYQIEAEFEAPWVLPANGRLVHEFLTHVVVARKD